MNAEPHALFVYGTLRRGGRLHRHMLDPTPSRILAATTPGQLIHLGAYPALIAGAGVVRGEWFEYTQPITNLLRRLDRIEGRAYRRIVRQVDVDGIGPQEAWLYEWAGPTDAGPVVASGDWMAG